MHLSRRTLLSAAGLGSLAAVVLPSSPARAADAFDTLRLRWRDGIVGTGFDPAAQPYAGLLTQTGTVAADVRATMTPSAADLWPDLPLTVSSSVSASYSRLKTMALAWAQPGTGLTGDASLAADVLTGLDHIYAHVYNESTTYFGNWWDWNIGSPQILMDTMTLLYDLISTTRRDAWLRAVDHFTPGVSPLLNGGASTGANRVDVCHVVARSGMLAKNATKLTTARDGLSPVFAYVQTGDGFYADGSFLQHTNVPYVGGYGSVLLGGMASLMWLLAGSSWAVTDPNRQILFDAVTRTYAPFVYNGLLMDGISGRGISRGLSQLDPLGIQTDDHVRGHAITSGILRLATAASPAEAATWRAMAKGWMQREYWGNLAADATMSVAALSLCLGVRDDASITGSAEPVNHRVFGAMDRAVHRRPTWSAAISMCSKRVTYYETGNGENLHGWHTGNGMTYWWGSTYGNGQYSDAFWPTVDPYRLPGTTVSKKALADGAGGTWGTPKPSTTWVGGATDGQYAALGQDTRGIQSTLTARKAWFCLDDSIVCLGAGITCTDGSGINVETIVDNRNLGGGTGNQGFTVNGTAQPTTMGWSATLSGTNWAHLAGFGGYLFPQGATIKALREARTGSWHDINIGTTGSNGGTTDPITRKYLTMWFDHGVDPSGSAYSYILLPGATAAATGARSAAPTVTVLANTAGVQAISDSATGVTAANFYTAGAAGPIAVSAPCSVLVRESAGTLAVAVADPTRAAATITVTLNRTGYSTASGDPQVSVVGLNPITLLVETGGAQGSSRTITFGTGATVTAGTSVRLSPTADAYVRDGSYASTNYGGDATLVAKYTGGTGSGYNRRSYLSFDLTGVAATPKRAVLWVYGYVGDSGGTHTNLSAYGVATDAWTESGLTWSNAPALGTLLSTEPVCTVADWLGLDVTSFVTAQQAGDKVATLALAQAAVGLAVIVNSRTNATNPAFLEVVT